MILIMSELFYFYNKFDLIPCHVDMTNLQSHGSFRFLSGLSIIYNKKNTKQIELNAFLIDQNQFQNEEIKQFWQHSFDKITHLTFSTLTVCVDRNDTQLKVHLNFLMLKYIINRQRFPMYPITFVELYVKKYNFRF